MTSLKFYSLGIVAQDKVPDDFDIYVTPIEIVPTITGNITDRLQVTGSNTDSEDNITSIQVEKKKFIKAEWIQYGTFNRLFPPDVRKGMTVAIYNYAGTNNYYWTTLFHEVDLLDKEKVTYFWSAKPQSEPSGKDLLSKGYYFIVDTINQFLRLHTTKCNNESISYDIEVDTANGVLTIKDDKENKIELLSQDGTLNINLNKEFNLNIQDNIKLTTPKNLEVELDKLSIKNSTGELVDILTKLVQANIDEMHAGNLGALTVVEESSKKKYQEILKELESFKK